MKKPPTHRERKLADNLHLEHLIGNLWEFPLPQVLTMSGLNPHHKQLPRRSQPAEFWNDKFVSIELDGLAWLNHSDGPAGYGPISLLLYLQHHLEVADAIAQLHEYAGNPKTSQDEIDPGILADQIARHYLIHTRKLDPLLIDGQDIEGGYSDVDFLHRTFSGAIIGYSRQSYWPQWGYAARKTCPQPAWFTTEGTAFPWNDWNRPVVLVEGPIEALSYKILHDNAPVCISVAGTEIDECLVQFLRSQPREIILALNNCWESKEAAHLCQRRLEGLRASVQTHFPVLGSWHEDLCAAHAHAALTP